MESVITVVGLIAPIEESVSGVTLRRVKDIGDKTETGVRWNWNEPSPHVNIPIQLPEPLQVNLNDTIIATRVRSLQESEQYGISFPMVTQNFLGVINGSRTSTGKTGAVQSALTDTLWGYSIMDGSKDALRMREIIQRQVAQQLLELIECGSTEQLLEFTGTSLMKELPFRDINGRFTPYGAEELRKKVREKLWDNNHIWVPWFMDMLDSYSFLGRPDVQDYLQQQRKMTS